MMYKVIAFLMLSGWFQVVTGQELLTLEECRKRALAYNKELQKTRYQQGEAIASQKAARTAYLPSVNADANFIQLLAIDNDLGLPGRFLPTAESEQAAIDGDYSGTSDVWSPGLSPDNDNLSVVYGNLAVVQPVYTGGRIKNTNKQADAMVDITRYTYDLKYAEIIELTDQSFWNVVMIKSTIELAERYMEMLRELEEQMNDMYEVGLQPASEKLKVSVRKNEAELELIRAKNSYKIAKMRLNQVLGQALDSPIDVDGGQDTDTGLFDLNEGVDRALTNRGELKVLEKQLAMSKYEKKVINADYLPQIGVNAGYFASYDNIGESVINNPMIGAQVTIPIFLWGQGRYKQQAAELRIRQDEAELENTTDLVSLEVMRVKIEVEEAYEVIMIAEKNISEAQESLEEVTASFEVGLNTTTDLLDAQAGWQEANVQLVDATAQYNILKTKWQRVIGELVPGE